MLLRVDGENERDQWLKRLTKASLDYITTKKKMEKMKQEKCMLLNYSQYVINPAVDVDGWMYIF